VDVPPVKTKTYSEGAGFDIDVAPAKDEDLAMVSSIVSAMQ
jgi:hypothetical protein